MTLLVNDYDKISACDDTAWLIAELSDCAGDLLKNISRMAAIVRRLDDLGVTISIENSLLPYVRLIAHGQLSANLFVALTCDSDLLEKAMRLPLPLQEQIAANEPMRVMELGGDHRQVRPLDMTKAERRQVFHGKRLRTDAEQIGFLRERQEAMAAKAASKEGPQIKLDRKRNGIVVGETFIPLHDLAGYIAALS